MYSKHPSKPTSPEYHIEKSQSVSLMQRRFYDSPLCDDAREQLQALVDNPKYDTDSTYFETQPSGFVDRHLHYLSMNPRTDVTGYISNLKVMTNKLRA